MDTDESFGLEMPESPKTIVIDYGGPNVAKPLHVGHLRSAVIGESVKRICRYMGNKVLGDVHLGDWGLQIGLIITEVKRRYPELPYFDDSYTGGYPREAPFTISDLEEIYPYASGYSKEHEDYMEEAQEATAKLQDGHRGYRALWQHILDVSIADLKTNYSRLDVEFDLWKKESDVQPYIPDMVQKLKDDGLAYVSEGALVVDVTEESDKKELPPCLIVKSNGATLYATTDLATIVEREKLYQPDQIIYLADKRQSMHFTQVFRVAEKAGIAAPDVRLDFIGFGTMNGKDGKPFNTGPYILYTIVRIKSLLGKYKENGGVLEETAEMLEPVSSSETDLYLTLSKYADAVESAYTELAPHRICQYIYELSEAFNHFYHETKILAEENGKRKASYLKLIGLVQRVLEQCIYLLGFEAPDKM